MPIITQVNDDMKAAMKAQEAAKLSTIRMLKTALKNKEIDLMRALTDDEALAVIRTQIKQLRDSAESFTAAGRTDLADPVAGEIATLEAYLPSQLSDAALDAKVREALSGAGLTSKADTGRAMGVAMKAVAGLADGARVKKAVESALA
ncbi:GatB/YqeY domain-containing protein [Patescibacteria group bacterium]|nr:MAG: GatB/YqeY domain-containing protein [Patescibacteria group bacterium]